MATQAPFLTTPYGGYFHRGIPKEDEELTHVGPGTPCGEYFRRFWQPVTFSEDLEDLPVAIRILGEDLVVFRDRSGEVGVLELHCSHRGTSLEFGLISEKGIRCCYHGWLYDVDGKILETPGEPADSTLNDRLCHGAYPAIEYGGLAFAYLGPPDKKPVFPIYDSYQMPGCRIVAGVKHIMPCNWLQIEENQMDPIHVVFLHTTVSGLQGIFTTEIAELPELDFMETPIGMVCIATRRVGDNVWVRMNDGMVPNIHQIPTSGQDGSHQITFSRPHFIRWSVPVDDTRTLEISFTHIYEDQETPPHRPGVGTWEGEGRSYEERQRRPGDYDAQMSQRPIAVHALEHLASTDRGVSMLRNLARQGIRAVQNGNDPRGVVRHEGEVVPTYANDTIIRLPASPTPQADRQLIRQTARKVAEGYIKVHPGRNGRLHSTDVTH